MGDDNVRSGLPNIGRIIVFMYVVLCLFHFIWCRVVLYLFYPIAHSRAICRRIRPFLPFVLFARILNWGVWVGAERDRGARGCYVRAGPRSICVTGVCNVQNGERMSVLLLLVVWDAAISGAACSAGPGCYSRTD